MKLLLTFVRSGSTLALKQSLREKDLWFVTLHGGEGQTNKAGRLFLVAAFEEQVDECLSAFRDCRAEDPHMPVLPFLAGGPREGVQKSNGTGEQTRTCFMLDIEHVL